MTGSNWSMQPGPTAADGGRVDLPLYCNHYTILYLGPVLQYLQKVYDLGPLPQN